MKVAVPTRDGHVDDHFGHCDHFMVFTIEDNAVSAKEKLESPEGCGCKSNIASVLKDQGVGVMLAGNIGQGAVDVLAASQIQVVRGCSGDIEELVGAWLAGKVKDNEIICDHHDCGSLHQL